MVNVLIINPGSSSVKFHLYSDDKIILNGNIENVVSYSEAAHFILKSLKEYKIDKIAYRVVYSGKYTDHMIITPQVIAELKKTFELSPNHMPQTVEMIEHFMKNTKAKHIACFDTVFHNTMPEVASIYAIPCSLTQEYNIKRYGFHGLAHQAMSEKAKYPGVITCQLGNGVSITAVKNGKSIDTSMGFTPLEGLVMGTRSGNIDPALVSYLAMKLEKTAKEVVEILQKESGLKGIAGESDMRLLLKRNDAKAKLAVDIFCYSVRKYIGAYSAVLGKVDAIVIGGGMSHNKELVKRITDGFKCKIIAYDADEEEVMYRISRKF